MVSRKNERERKRREGRDGKKKLTVVNGDAQQVVKETVFRDGKATE